VHSSFCANHIQRQGAERSSIVHIPKPAQVFLSFPCDTFQFIEDATNSFDFRILFTMSGNTKTPLHTSAKGLSKIANGIGDTVQVDGNGKEKDTKTTKTTSPWVYFALATFAFISYVTMPNPLQPHHGEEPSIQHVFYYGWLTAISTGLGAIPLVFAPNLASFWVGISNGMFFFVKKEQNVCRANHSLGVPNISYVLIFVQFVWFLSKQPSRRE
jgi:hypothetical protein